MRFDIITLLPELFAPLLRVGVTRRAFEVQAGQAAPAVEVHLHNPRDHAVGNYKRVDDRPFGGGPGMVMMAEPLALCLEAVLAQRAAAQALTDTASGEGSAESGRVRCPVILFSPAGDAINHEQVVRWANPACVGAVLLCGRYEGVDQRFVDQFVTHQLSLGDFVLSGGEIAAMALIDAVARLQSGVLGDQDSHAQDSFNPAIGGLLDCPHFTRPEVWRGVAAPEILMSGNHVKIEAWRHSQRVALTQANRPDLPLPDSSHPDPSRPDPRKKRL